MKFKYLILEDYKEFEYQIPTNPKEKMLEFYFLSTLPTPRDERLAYSLEQAKLKAYSHLREHLLDVVLKAICSEIFYAFEKKHNIQILLSAIEEDEKLEFSNKEIETIKIIESSIRNKIKNISKKFKFSDLQNIDLTFLIDSQEKQSKIIYEIVKKIIKDIPFFVKLAKKMFAFDEIWKEDFGGKAWVKICDAWLKLYEIEPTIKNLGTLQVYIDHIYDLQHNTDTIFDKVKEYVDENNDYGWIKAILDWKSNVVSPYEYKGLISSDLMNFGSKILYDVYKTTQEDWEKQRDKIEKPITKNVLQSIKPFINGKIKIVDNKIDVIGSVEIDDSLTLFSLPIKFNKVTIDFVITNNNYIKSLIGVPKVVTNFLIESCNSLRLLDSSPKLVENDFVIIDCYNLKHLLFLPNKVKRNININSCPIISLETKSMVEAQTLNIIQCNIRNLRGIENYKVETVNIIECENFESLDGLPKNLYFNLNIEYCNNINKNDIVNFVKKNKINLNGYSISFNNKKLLI